jgi:hypothetical protein
MQSAINMYQICLHRFRPTCAATLLLASAGISPAQGLLSDNFNAAGNPNPADLNYNLATRQAGSGLGTVSWTKGSGNIQVGWAASPNAMLVAGDGNSTSGLVSPDHSFGGAETAGGLIIEYDLDPQTTSFSAAWLAINLGMNSAGRWTGVSAATPHIGIYFDYSGNCAVFDGATVVGSFANAAVHGTFNHVLLKLSDATDGNPFDGVGQTTVAVYTGINPELRFTYTKANGGVPGGYLNFQASPADVGLIDNLSIRRIILTPPEVAIATYAGLTINGEVWGTYGIQANSTLGGETGWTGVTNVTLTTTSLLWHASQSINQQQPRFYRVVPGPISIP